MAWTQADIDALKRAIATGARRVEYGSGETRRVLENRSLAELKDILAGMEEEVAGALAPQRTAITQFTRD
jgi:hypothetical protein